MNLVETFLRYWGIRRPTKIEHLDLIVPISWGTALNHLNKITEINLRKAIEWQRIFPNSILAYCNPTNCFLGSEVLEDLRKRQILRSLNALNDRVMCCGEIHNSITEALQVKQSLTERGIKPKSILVITGVSHSRRAAYIWKNVFPLAEIIIDTIPHEYEFSADDPMFFQRSSLRIIFLNVTHYFLLRIFGLQRLARFSHPSSISPSK